MGDSSFTSILILLVLFIVLPSVLKLIGQYTLGSKNADKGAEGSEPAGSETDLTPPYMEEPRYRRGMEPHDETPVSKKPINPKWF